MNNAIFWTTPLGPLTAVCDGERLTHLLFGSLPEGLLAIFEPTPLLLEAQAQINEYVYGYRQTFDLPLAPHGTDFQLRVWEALRAIPYGETRTYRQLAEAIGQPNATCAVGGANHHNPLPIVIPCHRVIGKDGSLTGFGGGLGVKRQLLEIERRNVPGASRL